ncbi:MAG: CocE/NonD family hydrolase [Hyphomonadaceae bacterium]|nr:CocE/NonD family hydrolase [Hyphomonadaceae bacterium]
MSKRFAPIMRDGVDPKQAVFKEPHPGVGHLVEMIDGMRFERDIEVAMRDGVRILVDVFLPERPQGKVPAIVGWGPYGKHNKKDHLWPPAGLEPGWLSRHTAFEAPDPAYWCAHGYAVVYPDPRGTWYSQGEMNHGGPQEAEDTYDLIEWCAAQEWCNGRVGMSGVSYLAAAQYQVAPLQPPHLAAINPWEAFSDWYREFGYHGGMRDTGFAPKATMGIRWSMTRTEDTLANMLAHPLIDEYWRSKDVALDEIVCPALFVASWSDQGFHTRGTLEAYKAAKSRDKFLIVHGQKKWAHYYDPKNVALLREFFDATLRGEETLDWPKVRIEVRERYGVGQWRNEREWPLARTEYTLLHLDAASGALSRSRVAEEAQASYNSEAGGYAHFDIRFGEDTELTGHAKLKLWVEGEAEDMDLFVSLEKLDAGGRRVPFAFYAVSEDGPVALGWLRVSHRALDEAKSTPWQPVHLHTREDKLTPGETIPVEIEIWPSSTLFRAGETLRVHIQGEDIYKEVPQPGPAMMRHEETRNRGRHIIHTGGQYDSHLLIPVIPGAPK